MHHLLFVANIDFSQLYHCENMCIHPSVINVYSEILNDF